MTHFLPAAADAGFFLFRRLASGPWPETVNVYWYEEPEGVTLIDTGFFFSGPAILRALNGRPVRRILLTHFHPDHSGSAAYLQRHTGAPVYVHSADYDFVAGQKWLDEEQGWWVTRAMLKGLRYAGLSRTEPPERLLAFEDGDRFGEFKVLHTPGHTPGSSSFWNARCGVLFVGDNLVKAPWGMMEGVPIWTLDRGLQKRSLLRYRELPVRVMLSGHGPAYWSKPRESQECV